MLKNYFPHEYVESIFVIDYKKLYSIGYRGLIFDIDNTLVPHGEDSTKQIDDFFKYLHSIGFKTILLSNNSEERILRFLKNIDSMYICEANKPQTTNYDKAISMLEIDKKEALVIGDQIFTDILGANKSSIDNILVKFLNPTNTKKIGKRRQVEKMFLKYYKLV